MVLSFRAQQRNMQAWLDTWAVTQTKQLDRHHETLRELIEKLPYGQGASGLPPLAADAGAVRQLTDRLASLENSVNKTHYDLTIGMAQLNGKVDLLPSVPRLEAILHREGEDLVRFLRSSRGDRREGRSTSRPRTGTGTALSPRSPAVAAARKGAAGTAVRPAAEAAFNLPQDKSQNDFSGIVPGSVGGDTAGGDRKPQTAVSQHSFNSKPCKSAAGEQYDSEIPVWLRGGCPDVEDVKAAMGWKKHFPRKVVHVNTKRFRCCVKCSRLRDFVESTWFELVAFLIILATSALIGVKTEITMSNLVSGEDHGSAFPLWVKACELAVLALFGAEVLCRLFADPRRFWCGRGMLWNVLDIAVFAGAVVSTTVHELPLPLLHIRMLRVFRLVRLFRAVSNTATFRELRCMLLSVTRSIGPLCLILIVVASVTYIFAIAIMNLSAGHLDSLPQGERTAFAGLIKDHFGSLTNSICTLIAIISGGQPWRPVGTLVYDASPLGAALLGVYVGVMIYCVLNVITGIFVESVQKASQTDFHKSILKELDDEKSKANAAKSLLERTSDDFATMTTADLETAMDSKEMKAFLKSIGMDHVEADGMFKVLDRTGTGRVNIDEWVLSCMRLRGPASNIDLCTLMSENKQLIGTWSRGLLHIGESLERLEMRFPVPEPPPPLDEATEPPPGDDEQDCGDSEVPPLRTETIGSQQLEQLEQ